MACTWGTWRGVACTWRTWLAGCANPWNRLRAQCLLDSACIMCMFSVRYAISGLICVRTGGAGATRFFFAEGGGRTGRARCGREGGARRFSWPEASHGVCNGDRNGKQRVRLEDRQVGGWLQRYLERSAGAGRARGKGGGVSVRLERVRVGQMCIACTSFRRAGGWPLQGHPPRYP